jgi:hypothetical protein
LAPFEKNKLLRGCQGFTGLSPSTFLDKHSKEQAANIRNNLVSTKGKLIFFGQNFA